MIFLNKIEILDRQPVTHTDNSEYTVYNGCQRADSYK